MSYAQQHILLVDDDPGILVAVKQALAAHGYEVTTATNGLDTSQTQWAGSLPVHS